MRSMENAKPEKCKEYEVHRAAYSHSIKKFPHENFSCKLTNGARVRVLHAFRACPLWVLVNDDDNVEALKCDKNALSTLTTEGVEFGKRKREDFSKVQSSYLL